MPVVVRQKGFRVILYTDDHEPIHVHVEKAGGEVEINVATLELMKTNGSISKKDIRKAVEIVAQNQALIKQKWQVIHNES